MVDAAPAIYHLCRRDEWRAAVAEGEYPGSSQDAADGFIHFSSHDQVAASAAKHRAGQDGLVLLCVDPELLGEALKWEASTRGADGGTPDRDKTRGADKPPVLPGNLTGAKKINHQGTKTRKRINPSFPCSFESLWLKKRF